MAEIENAKKKLFVSNHRTFVFIRKICCLEYICICITCNVIGDPAMAMEAPTILVHIQ